MSLRALIAEALAEALKARNVEKLSILRMLWSAIKNAEIDKKGELTDGEIQQVALRQVKQLNDALKDFEKGGREDLIKKTKFEIETLQQYLPEQLSNEKLIEIVKKVLNGSGTKSPQDLGKIMGAVMKEVKGKADGNKVREIVNSLLSANPPPS